MVEWCGLQSDADVLALLGRISALQGSSIGGTLKIRAKETGEAEAGMHVWRYPMFVSLTPMFLPLACR